MKRGQPSWIGELKVDVTEVRCSQLLLTKCPNRIPFGLTVCLVKWKTPHILTFCHLSNPSQRIQSFSLFPKLEPASLFHHLSSPAVMFRRESLLQSGRLTSCWRKTIHSKQSTWTGPYRCSCYGDKLKVRSEYISKGPLLTREACCQDWTVNFIFMSEIYSDFLREVSHFFVRLPIYKVSMSI